MKKNNNTEECQGQREVNGPRDFGGGRVKPESDFLLWVSLEAQGIMLSMGNTDGFQGDMQSPQIFTCRSCVCNSPVALTSPWEEKGQDSVFLRIT